MTLTGAVDENILTLTIDPGKVNALDMSFFADLNGALDNADQAAVVITGREGMLSAGLDMNVMGGDDREAIAELLIVFGETMLRLWLEPKPIVVAATGHAVAGCTILCLASDHAVAAQGDYRWGLVETTIGYPLPAWIIGLARQRIAPPHLQRLLLPGKAIGPAEAVSVGFADELVAMDTVLETAQAKAVTLSQLPQRAYADTKRRFRRDIAAALADDIATDVGWALDAIGR